MGDIEYGSCEICHKEAALERTYFRYNIQCECHSPNHFEFVRHCSDCVPKEPLTTKITVRTEYLERI